MSTVPDLFASQIAAIVTAYGSPVAKREDFPAVVGTEAERARYKATMYGIFATMPCPDMPAECWLVLADGKRFRIQDGGLSVYELSPGKFCQA